MNLQPFKVFVNGCFDLLHIGHVRLLQYAKKVGIERSSYLRCVLIVGLNSDDSIIKRKGLNRPLNSVSIRKEMLESLNCVDDVIVFNQDSPAELIKAIKPDLIIKGPDYKGKLPLPECGNIETICVPWKKDISTSGLIERINKL